MLEPRRTITAYRIYPRPNFSRLYEEMERVKRMVEEGEPEAKK